MTNEELIVKIKAEIERLKGIGGIVPLDNREQKTGYESALIDIEIFLDSLEEQAKEVRNPIFDECVSRVNPKVMEEVSRNIDFELELYDHFGQVKDFTLGMRIGKYFYELGCRRTAEKYDEIEYNRQRADVCEGEDEEYEQIKQKVCSDCPSHKDDDCGYVTRQLQRKCNYLSDVMYGYELGKQEKPTTAVGFHEYIRKDALMEWLELNRNQAQRWFDSYHEIDDLSAKQVWEEVIDKINEL